MVHGTFLKRNTPGQFGTYQLFSQPENGVADKQIYQANFNFRVRYSV